MPSTRWRPHRRAGFMSCCSGRCRRPCLHSQPTRATWAAPRRLRWCCIPGPRNWRAAPNLPSLVRRPRFAYNPSIPLLNLRFSPTAFVHRDDPSHASHLRLAADERFLLGLAMPPTGTLKSWNDDRGFGFIAPRDGGREVFVHASAFPRNGSRPTLGETLVFELGKGKDGRPQAVRVYRQAKGKPSDYPSAPRHRADRRSPVGAVVGLLLVASLGAYGFKAIKARTPTPVPLASTPATPGTVPVEASSSFRCDGRTYCSQMSSCAEAKYFLKNCPGTKMDGNNDGIPCEQQWCTN